MILYLVQHGEALPTEIDPERPLSAAGRRDVEGLGRLLAGRGLRIARVLHSGKARARQTAEILAAALAPEAPIEAAEGLAPNDPPAPFAERMAGSEDGLLVTGHLPFMARLVSYLLTGDAERPAVAYRPGSVVCLERAGDGRWEIAWMLRPELLG
jgi:phosphohistidine phosphatase